MKPAILFFTIISQLNVDECQKVKHQKRLRENQRTTDDFKLNNKALTISYPLDFFSSRIPFNWRTKAVYDKGFVESNDASKTWIDFSKGQDGEDIWLYENWFYGMTNGVIMESGALDGILFSNSYMFESFANWTSINVEADPENYSNLKFNREKAININCALCSDSSLLHYSSEGVIPVRGFVEFMSSSFLKKWHKNYYNNRTQLSDLPTIPCVTVTSLLYELNIHHIDIWILDTEGSEESILKGIDFTKIHFNVIAMECDEHDMIKNTRKMILLENNNFICTVIERNCMCKHKSYIPSEIENKSILKKWDGVKWSGGYKGELSKGNYTRSTSSNNSNSHTKSTGNGRSSSNNSRNSNIGRSSGNGSSSSSSGSNNNSSSSSSSSSSSNIGRSTEWIDIKHSNDEKSNNNGDMHRNSEILDQHSSSSETNNIKNDVIHNNSNKNKNNIKSIPQPVVEFLDTTTHNSNNNNITSLTIVDKMNMLTKTTTTSSTIPKQLTMNNDMKSNDVEFINMVRT